VLYRRFGRTGIQVSAFSCGGMRAQQSWQRGRPVGDDNQRNFDAVVARALATGINHFETARGYGTSWARAKRGNPTTDPVCSRKTAPAARSD
jgi:predicted aldo/keto reductase-like oxidoreductase